MAENHKASIQILPIKNHIVHLPDHHNYNQIHRKCLFGILDFPDIPWISMCVPDIHSLSITNWREAQASIQHIHRDRNGLLIRSRREKRKLFYSTCPQKQEWSTYQNIGRMPFGIHTEQPTESGSALSWVLLKK